MVARHPVKMKVGGSNPPGGARFKLSPIKGFYYNQSILMDETIFLADFKNLNASNPDACNKFFEDYGIGNDIIQSSFTLERLEGYENLLNKLLTVDTQKYIASHKGTPYYFLGWLCFDIGHFSRAYFYFDLAVYEDRWHLHGNNDVTGWMNDPGAEIMLVKETGAGTAGRIRQKNYQVIKDALDGFSKDGGNNVTVDQFREKFLKKVLQTSLNPRSTKNFRPVVCSLFSFLMSYEDRVLDLKLRAIQNGSVEPFLTHIFLGCLVFESLMKMKYATNNGKKTLGNYISNAILKKRLGISKKISAHNYTFQEVINKLNSFEKKGNFAEVSVGLTYMLRNTTGHSLIWPDRLGEQIYIRLYKHIRNAILLLVSREYLS